ncbi:MAG: hypothetical protein L6Q35_14665 [Phycisphaerales bacterium]|nr:hypothetical protein [Phycisphaerales bacterium]
MKHERHKHGAGMATVLVLLAGLAIPITAFPPAVAAAAQDGGSEAAGEGSEADGTEQPIRPAQPAREEPGTVVRPPGTSAPGGQPTARPREQPSRENPQDGVDAPDENQPEAAQDGTQPQPLPQTTGDEIELSAFTEPVELSTLIEYVAKTLNINVSVKPGLAGSVVFNAPVKVPKSRLLTLLDALLEQQGYTITYDEASQFYTVRPTGEVPIGLIDGEQATTRVFATPNVRPSALKPAIDAQLGLAMMIPGQQPGQGGGSRQYAYVDELGVIVATDTLRKLAQVESLIDRLLAEYAKARFIRFELKHVAAPVARERALQLVGQSSNRFGFNQDPNIAIQQQQQGLGGISRGSFDNLTERLTIDPQGNALIFRGLPEEIAQVQTVLEVIDVPSTLSPRKHEVGKAARPIAEIARQRGLGEVTQISDTSQYDPNNPLGLRGGGLTFQDPNQPGLGQKQSTTGGPVMVVDETRGVIIYYGTEPQQAALKALVDELKTDDDRIVFRDYKLKNTRAYDVAEIIMGVLNNQMPAIQDTSSSSDSTDSGTGGSRSRSGSSLVSDFSGTGSSRRNTRPNLGTSGGSPEDGLSIENAEDIFIVPDEAHNQLIVKAPIRDQETLGRLITKLDLRRPQVYIEAKIVVVNWSDDLRLAFETQLINANGTGGVLNTNFGITGNQGNVLTPKTVPGLTGLTAAIIKSDQVPIVMTALQTEVDARILSTPQVLVDDNTKAIIDSKEQQPTTTTTIGSGGNPNTTTFNDYVDAGTKLEVTPTISDGGYIRLDYFINLSSFTGSGSNGIPPPKQDNTLEAKSVTVPSDATVVLGGITFDSESTTSEGVPILKDIPILGLLFQDLSKTKRKTTLYVFLTPTVMRDPNFADLRLMQEGPQAAVGVDDAMPSLEPTYIDVFERPLGAPPPPEPVEPASATNPAPGPERGSSTH